ncbi:MAG TPA: rhodanese-like domain-containing protein [Flavobacterium sp.]|nr:rhodanese-like domain-containing protein [Flavobacterium sp.]
MRKLLLAGFVSFLFTACNGQETAHYKVLAADQYEQVVTDQDVQIVDVRTAEEFAEGHLKGAKNFNIQNEDFELMTQDLDKEKPVYIYCRSGMRSAKAGKALEEMGFKEIYDLKGGILAWKGTLEE